MSKVLDKIEKEFQSTTWLILNRKLTNILDYEKWLTKNVVYIKEGKSQISKDKIYYTIIDDFYWDSRNAFKNTLEPNEKWLISEKDLDEVVAKRSINDNELENLRLENAHKILKDITYLTIEMVVGPNQNIEKCPNYAKSVNCYYGQYFHYSKNCAYCDDPHKSENVFGCWCLLDSKFCIKCHASTKLIRCLEVTTSHNCRDSYFCYNCEDLDNCMFCFNTKSKRYAIGNIEYPKEEYMNIKSKIIKQLADELEETKKLDKNVYNIGRAKV